MKVAADTFHWIPRIICIVAILFVSVFALDAFSPELTIWQQIGGFLMHLIPSFVLLLFLLVAWKWEYVGGIIFALAGIVMSPVIYMHNRNVNHFSISQCINVVLIISFPFVVVGVLFIVSHFLKKKERLKQIHS